MATLIRVKRKKTGNNSGVQLVGGEPYYNLHEKKLYIGDSTSSDEPQDLKVTKKHIAEVTNMNEVTESSAVNSGDAVVKFSVGESTDNQYQKTVNNVAITRGIILDSMYFGSETDRNNLAGRMGVDKVPVGTVFFQEAE